MPTERGLTAEVGVVFGEELGQAKIEDFDGAAVGDKNVGGLDVTVENPSFVGGVECVGELDADVDGARNREGAEGEDSVEGLAFEQLHGDESAAIVFFDGVNRANARMIERGRGAGFAKEALESLRVAARVFRKEFQGDAAGEFGVLGFVNNAHATFAKLADDAVMGDGGVEHCGRAERGW